MCVTGIGVANIRHGRKPLESHWGWNWCNRKKADSHSLQMWWHPSGSCIVNLLFIVFLY